MSKDNSQVIVIHVKRPGKKKLKPLSKEEIEAFGKEEIVGGRMSMEQIGKLNKLFNTALLAYEMKEALKFYSNIVEIDMRTDGFFVKRPCDDKWFGIMNKAREALKLWEAE